MSGFYKIKHGGGYPRSILSGQISPLSLLKCGLTTTKIAEIGNFWYKFAQKRFLQNMAWRREPQVRTLMPNFVTVG